MNEEQESSDELSGPLKMMALMFSAVGTPTFFFFAYIISGVVTAYTGNYKVANGAGGVALIAILYLWGGESHNERTRESRYKWSFVHCLGLVVVAAYGSWGVFQ